VNFRVRRQIERDLSAALDPDESRRGGPVASVEVVGHGIDPQACEHVHGRSQLGERGIADGIGEQQVLTACRGFKAPTLRNIVLTPPYFHSGKVWSLREAVAIMGSSQLGISLSEGDIDMILVFLETTKGEQPQITYPILPASTERTPKPKLD